MGSITNTQFVSAWPILNSQGSIELEDTPRIPKSWITLIEEDTAIDLSCLIKGEVLKTTQNEAGI